MTESQYADEWSRSADAFLSAGHYKWMCDQLGSATRVIEVGCGSGASTEALLTLDRQVLAIESNSHCGARTIARLRAKGISADPIAIDQLAGLASWRARGVKVLVADVISPAIDEHLPANWFDAVTCWMTGSNPGHISSVLGKPYMNFDGSEMPAFRRKVQQRCYDLGRHALLAQGVVHIVDRAAIRSWADKDQARQMLADTFRPIAGSPYTLNTTDCLLRKLTEGLNQSSIHYVGEAPRSVAGVLVLTSARAQLDK